MKTLISIDPGLSSGVAVGTYSNTEPYRLERAFQVEEGLSGFLANVYKDYIVNDSGTGGVHAFQVQDQGWFLDYDAVTIISEKFTPRQALSLKSAEPLRIEGALVAQGVMPDYPHKTWRQPIKQYFAGGVDLADRKKRAYTWLKENGFYVTGKTVGCKDANDARSAILHAIAWLRDQKHPPTLKQFF